MASVVDSSLTPPQAHPEASKTTRRRQAPAARAPSPEPDAEFVRVAVHRGPDTPLGITCARYARTNEAVLSGVIAGGLVHKWNQENPDKAVGVGDIMTEVNGQTDTWAILSELAKSGPMELVLHRNPRRGDDWKGEVSRLSEKATRSTATAKRGCCSVQKQKDMVAMSRPVRASTANVDYCAICADSVAEDDGVAMLACGHGFHYGCMAQWVAKGKRHVCPLCIRDLQ